MQSIMKKRFAEVPNVQKPRSTFDRSFGVKTTFDSGLCIPLAVDEIYPGDTVRCNLTGFARLSTPINPIMDNMYFDTHWFFAPSWLLWENFKKMMGEQEDPGDSISYTTPQKVVNNAVNQSLADYMGIPTQIAANNSVNALPFRLYVEAWDTWYRDQNLQDSQFVSGNGISTGDGPDTYTVETTGSVLPRGKRHDYFTSCLPYLQRGTAVELPLGTSAPVTGIGINNTAGAAGAQSFKETDATAARSMTGWTSGVDTFKMEEDSSNTTYPDIRADLSSATAATVNELRQATAVQRLLEVDARSGTRYPEQVLAHFGTSPPDLPHRPEFLGGGTSPIHVTPVAETASGSAGELGAMGTVGFSGHGFTKSFTSHGYLICIGSVRCDLTYQEGLERFWSRSTRYDYYHPLLANLGEMAVLNKEIYLDATDLGDGTSEEVFGYNEAWADLRYKPSKITGKMRSNDANTLDPWHLSIEFGDTPTLDDTFIVEGSPVDRVIATPTEPHFKFDGYFKYIHTRVLPTYSIPSLTSRF